MPQVSAAGTGIDAGSAPWLCDPYSQALASGRGPLFLCRSDGWMLPLEVERWCGGTDAADESVLERAEGDTVDVGCGPGRMVAALTARGHLALGVDTNPSRSRAPSRRAAGRCARRCSTPCPGRAPGVPPCCSTATSVSAACPGTCSPGYGRSSCPAACSSSRPRARTSTSA
ncbi:class I SAM-dependent methyltransferase [Nocardiopsis sp. ARC36]